MKNAKKNCNPYPSTQGCPIIFYLMSVTISKFHWYTANSWNKEGLCFGKKPRNAKNFKMSN